MWNTLKIQLVLHTKIFWLERTMPSMALQGLSLPKQTNCVHMHKVLTPISDLPLLLILSPSLVRIVGQCVYFTTCQSKKSKLNILQICLPWRLTVKLNCALEF